jgi:hypothetical protein
MWLFNPIKLELQFVMTQDSMPTGEIDLGTGDLEIDAGLRSDNNSIIDQGDRI